LSPKPAKDASESGERLRSAGELVRTTSAWQRCLFSGAAILAALLLFALANRVAYRSYFQADSIDNLALVQALPWHDLFEPLLAPKVSFNNFRPVGMLFFKLMGQWFGFWFPPYVAALQILHIFSAAVLVWLLRRLKLSLLAAGAGALFFVVHMASFSVHWEPMYVFDLLCGLLCLASLSAYVDDRWIVSVVLFWLAFRAKENAITLPLALAAYEMLLGGRRWKRLIPFFALAAVLGVQGLVNNSARNSDYTLHFDPASIWQCATFYSGQLLLVPFAGFAILALPLLVRDRRMWFGIACFLALIAPLLLLPGRLAPAYLYVPLIGIAISAGVLADRHPRVTVAALLLVWVPWNYVNLRRLRGEEVARGRAAHVYVANVIKAAQQYPAIRTYFYHDVPMDWYVIPAAVRVAQHYTGDVRAFRVDDPSALATLRSQPLLLLDWEPSPPPGSVVALARTPQTADLGYIRFDRSTPLWQLERGFNLADRAAYRWIGPSAIARLWRPEGAKHFELTVNASDAMFKYVQRSHLRVLIDGRLIGERDFDHQAVEPLRWNLDPAPAGTARVDFEVTPGFKTTPDGDPLALNIGAFGFVP
jgi:hypothetical protein